MTLTCKCSHSIQISEEFLQMERHRNDCIKLLKSCPKCLSFNEKKITKTNFPILIGESMERVE